MILKRPYAFFIKHFKLIHFLLLVSSIYVLVKTTPIMNFFRLYVANNYSSVISDPDKLISFFIYFFIAVILLIIISIIFLFSYKKKKKTFYIFYLVYYIILLVVIVLASLIFASIKDDVLKTDTARVYRDLSILFYLPQLPFIAVCFIRSLGFNLKEFSFDQDHKDLMVTSEDNEEVELSIGLETYKTKRKLRKTVREFKYYFKENAFLVIILLVIGLAVGGYILLSSIEIYDKSYQIGDNIVLDDLNISISDSIITNLDSGGNIIKKDSHYILLKIYTNNGLDKETSLDYKKIRVFYKGKENTYLNADLNSSSYFVDYAIPYSGNTLISTGENYYVLAYEISNQLLNKKFYVQIATGGITKNNVYHPTFATIKINPLVIDDVALISEYKINETISLDGTYLKNSKVLITDYEFTDCFFYKYQHCVSKDNCSDYQGIVSKTATNETIMVLYSDITLDKDAVYSSTPGSKSKFPNNFFKIRYVINGQTKTVLIENVTPKTFGDGYIFKVKNEIPNAESICLLVTVRNKQYSIKLK